MYFESSQQVLSRLAVAMIVRDAEHLIERTLRSVQSIADMIAVVDTGSSDGTVQLARGFTPNVYEFDWQDDFSAARNHCLEQIRGDWILWLDAGETIEQNDARLLRAFVDEKADQSRAYMLLVKVPPSKALIAPEQVGRVRLVPHRRDITFSGRVDERMTESLLSSGIETEGLPWRIHRGEEDNQPLVKTCKARRNIRLAEVEIDQHGPHTRWLNCLGEAHATLGDKTKAAELFRQSVEAGSKGSTETLEAYYGLLTSLDGQPRALEVQLAVCLQALESYPLDAQLLCATGGYLQAQQRLDLASRAYQTAFQYGQVNPETWHLDEIRSIAAVCLSLTLQLQGQDDDALKVLEEALQVDGDSLRVRRQLIDLHIKHGRREPALAQFDLLPAQTPQREALRSAVRGACLASQKNWIPALAYLKTGYDNGCRDTICLRWYSISLLASGDISNARPVIDEWFQREPENTEVQAYRQALESTPEGAPQDATPAPTATTDPSTESRHVRVDHGQLPAETDTPHPSSSGAPLPQPGFETRSPG